MRKRIIAGNWKLNGSAALCEQFSQGLAKVESAGSSRLVLVCPPLVYLQAMAALCADQVWQVGAQSVSSQSSGAYTGEVSASMLAESGATHCIVGHSERRALFGETDDVVLAKVRLLLDTDITPILCVGESLAVREQGQAEAYVADQLRAIFKELDVKQRERIVVAYEPVWAIGTGVSATASQAQAMHENIREVLSEYLDAQDSSILYGGSVNAKNAEELLSLPDVDGALIGGASLDLSQFLAIANIE